MFIVHLKDPTNSFYLYHSVKIVSTSEKYLSNHFRANHCKQNMKKVAFQLSWIALLNYTELPNDVLSNGIKTKWEKHLSND